MSINGNGTSAVEEKQQRHKVLIVGGLEKNVPDWAGQTFDILHYDQRTPKRDPITVPASFEPDLVIVILPWASHRHMRDAQDIGRRGEAPTVVARGGWTSVMEAIASRGLTWFMQEIEEQASEGAIEDVREQVNNAWQSAYQREYEQRLAMQKRLRRVREEGETASRRVVHLKRELEASRRREARTQLAHDAELGRMKSAAEKIVRTSAAKVRSLQVQLRSLRHAAIRSLDAVVMSAAAEQDRLREIVGTTDLKDTESSFQSDA